MTVNRQFENDRSEATALSTIETTCGYKIMQFPLASIWNARAQGEKEYVVGCKPERYTSFNSRPACDSLTVGRYRLNSKSDVQFISCELKTKQSKCSNCKMYSPATNMWILLFMYLSPIGCKVEEENPNYSATDKTPIGCGIFRRDEWASYFNTVRTKILEHSSRIQIMIKITS